MWWRIKISNVLCTGKVYYDLLEEREKQGIRDVYLLRVEQLFPVPKQALLDELARFPTADVVWCQEEPRNMGSWSFIREPLEAILDELGRGNDKIEYAGRVAAAAPATGLHKKHMAEQGELVHAALGVTKKA